MRSMRRNMMMMMMTMIMMMMMMMMTGTSTVQFDGSNQMTIDRRQEIAAEAQDITLRCETVIITIITIILIVIIIVIVTIITLIVIITVIVTFKSRYHTRFKSRNHPACHYLIHCDIWFTIIITIGVLIISSLHQSTFITYGYTNTCVA